MSFKRIRLIVVSLLLGVGCYFLYAFIFVPNFLIHPLSIQKISDRRQVQTGPAETIEKLSRQNAQLLAPLFPDPQDWRRGKPGILMAGNQSGLFLFEGEPNSTDENRVLSLLSCTIVIPSQDETLSIEERYRRAIVIETKDRLVLRFKRSLDLNSFSDFSFDVLEEGKLYGEVTVWSNMESESLADDIRLTTRDVSFNSEQLTTDSEVVFHYGNHQGEGTGLRVYLDMAMKNRSENEPKTDKNPLITAFENGNLFSGFSIKEVRLAKLNRLEFEIPDYLPKIPNASNDVTADIPLNSDEEKDHKENRVKLDIRCQDEVFFAPNPTDDPAVWGARFTGSVEVTAYHEEREQDSLQCESLYFYLIDPELKKNWEEFGASYKGKRKPSGSLTKLIPYQIRAIGSVGKKAQLTLANDFLRADGGEIICEIATKRLTLHPPENAVSPPVGDASTAPPTTVAPPISEPVTLTYGATTVTSDKIDFTYDPDHFGKLAAYKKGSLRSDYVNKDGVKSQMSVDWNDGVRIVPTTEDPNLHVASFRGGVRFGWDAFGEVRAEETDFWFQVKKEEKETEKSLDSIEDEFHPAASVIPQSVQFRRQIQMKTIRGNCQIQDEVNIRFAQGNALPTFADGAAPSNPTTGVKEESGLFGKSGSLMGGEGKSNFLMTGGRLNLWAVLRDKGAPEISQVTIQDNIRFLETDPDNQTEKLRIEGNDVRIDHPNSERASVVLRGQPANFTGSGLNLTGYDIRVNRAENTFSVIGSGKLRFTPSVSASEPMNSAAPLTQKKEGDSLFTNVSAPVAMMKENREPVEVWWPRGMTFDGKSLIFQGMDQESKSNNGKSREDLSVDDRELVLVRWGNSLELKSPLISLILKDRIEIFDFDMEGGGSTSPKEIALEKSVCQGTPTIPVTVSWFGSFPIQDKSGKRTNLKGRCKGEVAHLTLTGGNQEINASGPGWLRGTMETPQEAMKSMTGQENSNERFVSSPKAWSHLHLVFSDHMTGNIKNQEIKVNGDVRTVLGSSESSESPLDVNDRKTFFDDAFFLTCDELGIAQTTSATENSRFFEMTAFGDTRFDYQTYVGRGEILKYNNLKKTVILQGNGLAPASLSRQERSGAPVNTQTFNSVMFNLETKKIETNISGTGFSGAQR